jgi:hypothetical protein
MGVLIRCETGVKPNIQSIRRNTRKRTTKGAQAPADRMENMRRTTLKRQWLFIFAISLAALWLGGPLAYAQDKENTRSEKGLVVDDAENPIGKAVVQIKNTRTLQVKSFISTDQGQYYFHGLDPNVDYEIKARSGDQESRTRTISTFADRMELVYNLEVKSK